jgi:hypothetical protein
LYQREKGTIVENQSAEILISAVSQIQNFEDAKNLPGDAVSLFEIQEILSI